MKKRLMYLFEVILAFFIVILKFVFIDKFNGYYQIVDLAFWLISCFVIYEIIGLKRNNKLVTKNATNYAIISVLTFFVIIYLSGLLLGFTKCGYSLKFINILKNVLYLIIMIVSEELIRYMFVGNTEKKMPIIILNILYILLDFVLVFSLTDIENNLNIFIFVTTTLLPIIARHLLFTYNAKHVGYKANLIIRLSLSLYVYILPIQPDLSYFLSSVVGIIYPYLVYIAMNYLVLQDEKIKEVNRKLWYIKLPCIVIIITLIILISGIFKYQIMSIGSGSMEPVYTRGDAVIFEKISSVSDNVSIGDIVVFKHNNTYVTHRVTEINDSSGEIILKTKGDNNDYEDDFDVNESEVVGIVKCSIKYIGYPSVWFQDFVS